jgi:hypothetical protein
MAPDSKGEKILDTSGNKEIKTQQRLHHGAVIEQESIVSQAAPTVRQRKVLFFALTKRCCMRPTIK